MGEAARQDGKDVDDRPDKWSHACSLAQIGTSPGEHFMDPLHFSIVCGAERMLDGACAAWLRSAKVV